MATDTLEIKGVQLVMYAGLIGKIDKALGGFGGMDEISLSPELQLKVVDAIVTKYNEKGEADGKYFDVFTLSPDDFQAILKWGIDAYTLFTSKSSMMVKDSLKVFENKETKA